MRFERLNRHQSCYPVIVPFLTCLFHHVVTSRSSFFVASVSLTLRHMKSYSQCSTYSIPAQKLKVHTILQRYSSTFFTFIMPGQMRWCYRLWHLIKYYINIYSLSPCYHEPMYIWLSNYNSNNNNYFTFTIKNAAVRKIYIYQCATFLGELQHTPSFLRASVYSTFIGYQ